mmetsp:Transcript_31205/g.83728  ORF Transcript_31205/g.83728 Transcript_31205/m.83728 type:complete len:244 (-) Transcript_31205:13-744(-)
MSSSRLRELGVDPGRTLSRVRAVTVGVLRSMARCRAAARVAVGMLRKGQVGNPACAAIGCWVPFLLLLLGAGEGGASGTLAAEIWPSRSMSSVERTSVLRARGTLPDLADPLRGFFSDGMPSSTEKSWTLAFLTLRDPTDSPAKPSQSASWRRMPADPDEMGDLNLSSVSDFLFLVGDLRGDLTTAATTPATTSCSGCWAKFVTRFSGIRLKTERRSVAPAKRRGAPRKAATVWASIMFSAIA